MIRRISFTLIVVLFNIALAYSQDFDFESPFSDGPPSVSQTKGGITLTVTSPGGVDVQNYTGYTLVGNNVEMISLQSSITFSFDHTVTVNSLNLTDLTNTESDGVSYTFTPNTGSPFVTNVNGFSGQLLNFPGTFTNVTSFTVTKTDGGTFQYAYDNISVTLVSNPVKSTTTTTLSSNLNPSFTSSPNNMVTLTATVTSDVETSVITGTVTFKDGTNTLVGGDAVALSGGMATLPHIFTAEGIHSLTAVYSGDNNYSTSTSSTVLEAVNNHTTINGSNFSNNGAIAITDNSAANPYPSNIFVSGLNGNISALTLTINNFSTDNPSDLDILLAGPNGKFVIMNDAGGSSSVNGVNLTFSDAAGSSLPSVFSSSSYKPTSNGSLNSIPTPSNPFYSPSGTYTSPSPIGSGTFFSVFDNTDPNGTWSLYVYDDFASGAGSIAGGWSLNYNTTPLPVELTSFIALTNNNIVNLLWTTATEINNYGFEIQRNPLLGGVQGWVKVGFVKGNGNSNSPKDYSFIDTDPLNGDVEYRLKQIDNDGAFKYSSIVTVNSLPTKFELFQNYPNPFNPTTTIRYSIPNAEHVTLKVYDELGKEVSTLVDEKKVNGSYSVKFNGLGLASGIYYYRITGGDFRDVKKMMLLK